jgi:hypothetical protein
MAHLVIRLVTNPVTGRREVDIGYESDADALPMEHEQEHRRLVEQLVGSISDGKLAVQRAGAGMPGEEVAREEPQAEKEKLRQ